MAVETPPLAILGTGLTNPPEQFRRLVQALLPVGSLGGIANTGDLLVQAQVTPNNTVRVAAGGIFMLGTNASQGAYYGYNPSTLTPPALNAPDPTNPRHDLIVAHTRDSNYAGQGAGSNLDWIIEAIAGTPAATPLDPTMPANGFALARVTIPASNSALVVTSGMITDLRSNSERSLYRARTFQSGGHTIATGSSAVAFDVTDYDPGASLGVNVYTVKVTGFYQVNGQMRINNVTQTGRFISLITVNGTVVREGNETPAIVGYFPGSVVSDQIFCVAGQTIGLGTFWSGGTAQTSLASAAGLDCFMSVGLTSPA